MKDSGVPRSSAGAAAYTAGEWSGVVRRDGGWTLEGPNGFVICQRAAVDHRAAESRANARLIAHAPELYSALYRLVMVADTGSDFTAREVSEILSSARGLLLKLRLERATARNPTIPRPPQDGE
jgi:hypothetical protein